MAARQLRMILLGSVGGAILIFLVVVVLGLSMLAKQSQKMVNLKLQSISLSHQLEVLGQAKKQVQQYSYIKGVAAEVIPNDKDQAQAVLEISKLADESGIAIQNITFPSSNLTAGNANSSTLISQAKPVPGIKGLYSVQLDITPQAGTVTYDKMLDFLNRIELNQRTAEITQLSIQPQGSSTGGSTSGLSFTLSVNIFIKK